MGASTYDVDVDRPNSLHMQMGFSEKGSIIQNRRKVFDGSIGDSLIPKNGASPNASKWSGVTIGG